MKDFFPNFKKQKVQQEALFNAKMDELGRTFAEIDKASEKQFKKLVREEKHNGLSDGDALRAVMKNVGSETEYAQ